MITYAGNPMAQYPQFASAVRVVRGVTNMLHSCNKLCCENNQLTLKVVYQMCYDVFFAYSPRISRDLIKTGGEKQIQTLFVGGSQLILRVV